jgi:hypothetical protein
MLGGAGAERAGDREHPARDPPATARLRVHLSSCCTIAAFVFLFAVALFPNLVTAVNAEFNVTSSSTRRRRRRR